MRVLIDECLDWRIGRALPGHSCISVQKMGWNGITNGKLLQLMKGEGFDVFITGDRNLQFQQNVATANIAVVVLAAGSTRLIHMLPLMNSVLAALDSLQPGDVVVVRSDR